jgi:hypothetical protein
MRRISAVALLAVALAFSPTAANAQQLFDFDGQAILPVVVGGELNVVAIVLDGAPFFDTPLPLDFGSYQYTLVIEGVTLDSVSGTTSYFSGGTITLFEDAATAADYANPATFADGTALLIGTFDNLSRSTLLSIAQATGSVNWVGGTRLDDLAPADRLDWGFFASISAAFAEPGYDENWDGKVEPREPVVPNAEESFGGLRSAW